MNNSPVRAAIDAISSGASARDLESQHLDFKEDPARTAHPRSNPDSQRAQILLDAAICFANAEGESHLVLGVNDKARGPDAFTGTDADPQDVRAKIFNRTVPNLTVEVEEIFVGGTRLLDLRIPTGLGVYTRTDGAASHRVGTDCVPLREDERRDLAFQRANPDITARRTSLVMEDLDPQALALAHRLFTARSGDVVTSDADLLRRLGLMSSDQTIFEAARILLGDATGSRPMARHVLRRIPGGEPSATEYRGPMIDVLARVEDRISAISDPEVTRVHLPSGQETPVPDFPTQAVDEAVTNAFVHRDWSSSLPIVIDQSPTALTVDSPGPLPMGVTRDTLLTTRSMPRNPTLMGAMHALGLVEETSRGFDRMWSAMLLIGRDTPEVLADDAHVSVTFTASTVDERFVLWLAELSSSGFDPTVITAVSTLIVLRHLQSAPSLSSSAAARILHLGVGEATAQLHWLSRARLMEPLSTRPSNEWQLTDRARSALEASGAPVPRQGAVETWIVAQTDEGRSISNREVTASTGAPSREVTKVLRYLADSHRIQKDPEGPSRGPGVRWIRVGSSSA